MQVIYSTKGWYVEYIKNSLNTVVKKNATQKWAKDMNRYSTKEDIQIANKHMKTSSTSLAIREI